MKKNIEEKCLSISECSTSDVINLDPTLAETELNFQDMKTNSPISLANVNIINKILPQ